MQADVEKSNVLQTLKNNTDTNTKNQISGTLLQFPEQVINANQLSDPQMAATTYLQYLTKPYQSLTDNIHFSELKTT